MDYNEMPAFRRVIVRFPNQDSTVFTSCVVCQEIVQTLECSFFDECYRPLSLFNLIPGKVIL